MKKRQNRINRIRRNLTFLSFLGLPIIIFSCGNAIGSEVIEDENQTEIESNPQDRQPDLSTATFIKNLQEGNKLSGFFADNWTLIYHENSRLDGNTDGQVQNLARSKVDEIITLSVFTDGEGWAENPGEIRNHDIEFQLKERIKDWDGYSTEDIDRAERNMVYISTTSQSEYLQVYYNDEQRIIKLKFNLVDPG